MTTARRYIVYKCFKYRNKIINRPGVFFNKKLHGANGSTSNVVSVTFLLIFFMKYMLNFI